MVGSIYETLEGSNIEIGCDGESLTVNGIKMVLKKDIVTSNGVIHLIDQVLMPDSGELRLLSRTSKVQLITYRYIHFASHLCFFSQPSRCWSLSTHLKVSSRTWCLSSAFLPPCSLKLNIPFSPRSMAPSLVSLDTFRTFSRGSVFLLFAS